VRIGLKQLKLLLGIVLVVSAVYFVVSYYHPTQAPLSLAGCHDVFCNDYEFICCGEQQHNPVWMDLGGTESYTCPGTKCVVLSVGYSDSFAGYKIGSRNCDVHSFLGVRYIACDDDTTYTSTPVTFYPGQVLHSYDQRLVKLQVQAYTERLAWCGDAACDAGKTGISVSGADGCSFVTDSRVYDETGRLINDPKGSQLMKTVPLGECYLSVKSRHVCGNTCESCKTNSDCVSGHTLIHDGLGAECVSGQLQIYGCRDYGNVPSDDLVDVLPWESSPDLSYGSRCEIISSRPVQCCPYTDSCGQGTCDPDTFTCKDPPDVECTADWQCGQAEYCNREELQLERPICNILGRCENQKIKDVECCYDNDCPKNWYCDNNYKCKESTVPKVDCPQSYECCINEASYYDKPCPLGKQCIDNECISPISPTECMAKCNKMSAWNPMKQLCELKCSILEILSGLGQVIMWGIIMLFAVVSLAIVAQAIKSRKRRR